MWSGLCRPRGEPLLLPSSEISQRPLTEPSVNSRKPRNEDSPGVCWLAAAQYIDRTAQNLQANDLATLWPGLSLLPNLFQLRAHSSAATRSSQRWPSGSQEIVQMSPLECGGNRRCANPGRRCKPHQIRICKLANRWRSSHHRLAARTIERPNICLIYFGQSNG